jgi:hypothetical protein
MIDMRAAALPLVLLLSTGALTPSSVGEAQAQEFHPPPQTRLTAGMQPPQTG